jgi:hypothetical protein
MDSEYYCPNASSCENRITYRRWTVMRFVVAAILLIAAGLKTYQLATTPSLGDGLLHNWWFNVFVVEFELFIGVWLILGLLPKLTWLVTICLFSIFSLVTFYEAVIGEKSCNCFGNVTVNPWITMTFDLIMTGLLLIFLPKKYFFHRKMFWEELTGLRHKGRIVAVVGIWLAVTVPMMFAMLSVNFITLTTESSLSGSEKSVVLEPSKWVGKKFPLLQFLESSDIDKISMNSHNIVLFRFDCDECKQMIGKIQDKDHYVFIAIPSEKNNEVLFSLPEYLTLPDIL